MSMIPPAVARDTPCRGRMAARIRGVALLLLVAASLASCSDAVIGPVDHSCRGNPMRSQGSGCEDSNRD